MGEFVGGRAYQRMVGGWLLERMSVRVVDEL